MSRLAVRIALLSLAGLLALGLAARPLALVLIDEYQRSISPRKGYSCSHARLYGGLSCSAYGEKVIRERGIVEGWRLLRKRFAECQAAGEILRQKREARGPLDPEPPDSKGNRCLPDPRRWHLEGNRCPPSPRLWDSEGNHPGPYPISNAVTFWNPRGSLFPRNARLPS